jgi:cell wall-associated NlpC family hydrolase
MMDVRTILPGVILLTALLGGCAAHSTAPRPSPFPRPGSPGAARPSAPSEILGRAVVQQALALRGAPYAPGGAGPDRFDCSGLVHFVYRSVGIELPRTVVTQRAATHAVPLSAVRPGDLLFFKTEGSKPSHVAIALGDGSFVHAPSARGAVRVESLSSTYWGARLESARRVDGSAERF